MNNNRIEAQIETVQILYEGDGKNNSLWQPAEGDATRTLREKGSPSRIDEQEWKMIKTEAISVLAKCVPPKAPPRPETGLVVGYVQSGKTLSFTTVAALARDNNYQMIIVIAGTSVNLLNQSTERLEKDLDLGARSNRRWKHFQNPKVSDGDHTKIENALVDWQDSTVELWECQTVLITVMKHHQHLENLTNVLSRIKFSEFPALIIDDEGDQASLNTMVQEGEASTTYQRILALRECLQHHTFLQYTATPQAPLLINLIDVLSPNFTRVLSPGTGYKGGKAFFRDAPNQICTIPSSEIPIKDQLLNEPPESLLEAMRIFFLGVAAGGILDQNMGNRSMMIHPSHETIEHRQYLYWVEQVMEHWQETLKPEADSTDRSELLEEFKNSYESLRETVPNLPSFEKLSIRLPRSIRKTQPLEINSTSGTTPTADWSNTYSHILVGGQAMDRGFTVEGLTVTYMPRSKGSGNADTIQQRARFFGYKENDFGYCRVFLENDVRDAYYHYITHEEDVRTLLIAHDKTGEPLNIWRRAFFLDSSLKPTRRYVLDIDYSQGNLGNQWHTPRSPHDPIEAVEENRSIVENFTRKLLFEEHIGDTSRPKFWHPVATNVLLKDVCKELLVPLQFKRWADTEKFTQVHLQIAIYLDSHPDELCTVYYIKNDNNPRKRNLDEKGEIPELYQGPSLGTGEGYPGDRQIKAPRGVTIQIHEITVVHPDGRSVPNVPTVAIWLPRNMSADMLIQDQGGPEIGS